ncbi:hypothetical protein GGTG_13542 [Gaeumannomyces tritici R3-111a-1]|uniref:Uncharacterized protein n=1 Tax=Gaeumannomyces tritici (strain R3-111a-1) TaxID=644352 RepID=J3PJ60_GAET3|nr:hypothetical protein GGTG_13542 [Gaeumannomyces tritici R3-111a-1]EJT68878.1 hypothetical protein GGTG_13542 [Gaeumannomyces tritici R3-111a-1]
MTSSASWIRFNKCNLKRYRYLTTDNWIWSAVALVLLPIHLLLRPTIWYRTFGNCHPVRVILKIAGTVFLVAAVAAGVAVIVASVLPAHPIHIQHHSLIQAICIYTPFLLDVFSTGIYHRGTPVEMKWRIPLLSLDALVSLGFYPALLVLLNIRPDLFDQRTTAIVTAVIGLIHGILVTLLICTERRRPKILRDLGWPHRSWRSFPWFYCGIIDILCLLLSLILALKTLEWTRLPVLIYYVIKCMILKFN